LVYFFTNSSGHPTTENSEVVGLAPEMLPIPSHASVAKQNGGATALPNKMVALDKKYFFHNYGSLRYIKC
jgi:hypothetical protein